MTSPFTCITCRVAFRDLDIQRQHYKSDWHRYNLKRKVAELPPASVEEFQKRVITQRTKGYKEKEEGTISCKICKKNFNTRNQYENHLLSKKHKEKCAKQNVPFETENEDLENNAGPLFGSVIKKNVQGEVSVKQQSEDMEVDSDIESINSDEWIEDTENPVTNNNCLFCNHHSRSLVRNLKHMTIAHSFFVPDPEYCTDIKGLLVYLGKKIFAGYMCIWCNDSGRCFQSVEAARAHMIDKGHCKMLHEGDALAEYAEFYDYSSSYPDAEIGDPDAEVEIPELDDSDYQLVLPSGSIIGHRSLFIYYKQNLNPNRAVSKSDKLRKILSQYRALGWSETQKEAVAKKARDIKYMERVQAKYSTQLQFKANKLQKHFRPQVNF
ncbi:cytoplasmic 60S subunit biogenesis factor ZNF622 [Bombus vancouverensis nearcticus]|uniref:cytoplasmic 60S subunit biogenesis factor ZNF622 n=1 Tax=Bombus vancouverensis nearcticus TaxID=2705178 RepID=UPI00143BE361|nr:zinc finger protein 622 [Bombus vancouverensis nearcticus]